MNSIKVGVFVFPDVEVLDFAGPYEVFTTAARVSLRRNPAAGNLFDVFTVAESTANFTAELQRPVKLASRRSNTDATPSA